MLSVATEGRRYADDEGVEFSELIDSSPSQRDPFGSMDLPKTSDSPSLEAALEAVLESDASSKVDDDQPEEDD